MCGGENDGNFGCPKCTGKILDRKYGWIECKSTSFPGKVYYFHTITGCSTWYRPVSRDTLLPKYKKLRVSGSFQSPNDRENLNTFSLGVSETQSSLFSSDTPPTEFELHARRMQIYLRNDTNYDLGPEYERSKNLRDKLLEQYKIAKCELAEKLNEKKRPKRTVAKIKENVKPVKILKPIEPVKIIRECHGIKTISYDPVPRELPIGVEMPDLSETSIHSLPLNKRLKGSYIMDGKNSQTQGRSDRMIYLNDNLDRFGIKDVNLSESETTLG